MIPQTNTLFVDDTLPGKETEFTIGDPFWIMESLSDLYSNKEKACVRELSTNARDAQVEAGNGDKPIIVTLPTVMNPYFKVKDSGVGMSVDELEEIYTSFGVSTKRGSNDYNGILGFGSKAPIAYTGTFTVTSVKDGIKAVAVITKKPGKIVLKVVMTSKTDEPNGVEVSVPVHNHQPFAQIARDFYRFWFPGTVLVDGVEPKQAVGEKIDDNLYYSTNSGTSYVVMGNVGYRIANPEALFKSSAMSHISFVAFVENGSVEFTPSREDLKYTDHTKATLHKVIADFENKMIAQSRKEIEQAKSHFEAWKMWNSWGNRLGHSLFKDVTYKSEKFTTDLAVTGTRYEIPRHGYYNSRYNTQRINVYRLTDMSETVIVHEFEPELNSSHKSKMREFRKHVDFGFNYVIFTHKKVENKWIDAKRIVTWDEVKATIPKKPKPPRVSGGYSRPKGKFDYWTKDGWFGEADLPASGTIYYVTVQQAKETNLRTALTLLNDDGIIVILAKNRIAKFTRDNPKSKNFVEEAKKKVILDGKSLIDDEAKRSIQIGDTSREWLSRLDVSKIDDPVWAATKELIKPKADALGEYERHWNLARALGMPYSFVQHRLSRTDESMIKGYPLLDNINTYRTFSKQHVYIYLNAAYAESKKGN